MAEPVFPIAIIGAGASGLFAAMAASGMRPHSVLLLEKEARVGRKLLATGNGRCNLLNMAVDPSRYHGGGRQTALSLLAQTPPATLADLFDMAGLLCREEKEGRVYPFSGQAASVLDVLRAACARGGVETRCDTNIVSIHRKNSAFVLASASGEVFHASRVIIAAGGRAAPSFGADGGAYTLLSALGHKISPPMPALSPLKLPPERIRGLKGVRIQATLTLLMDGRPARVERGEALFAEYGLSGVAAMQLSRAAGDALALRRRAAISIGLMEPDTAKRQLAGRVSRLKGEPMENLLTGLLHKRVSQCLLREAAIPLDAPISESVAAPLLPLLSGWELPIAGVLPFPHAQVTAGGAVLSEFCEETLASRIVPGLYACGEALDVDGDCGGYNLMWAWVSALAAGRAAAQNAPISQEDDR